MDKVEKRAFALCFFLGDLGILAVTCLLRGFNLTMCHTANNVMAGTNTPPMAVSDFAAPSGVADHHPGAAGEIEGAGASHHLETPELIRIAFVGLAIIALWLWPWESYPHFGAIGFITALVGGYPIFKEAVSSLVARRMTMELSMTIAVGAALAIAEIFTALVIIFFVLIAEVLEGLTVGRGRRAVKDLLDLLPRAIAHNRD
jgi:Cd2+/Zn2+-exporting ATPase/Cu+-exporting ATPase